MAQHTDAFGTVATLNTSMGPCRYYSLPKLADAGWGSLHLLPVSIRILLENALRHLDHYHVSEAHIHSLADWGKTTDAPEIPFRPARVLLQDFTGVPAVVDLAAMRSAMQRLGGEPRRINPQVPVDLVIDHSVQVDHFGSSDALQLNVDLGPITLKT